MVSQTSVEPSQYQEGDDEFEPEEEEEEEEHDEEEEGSLKSMTSEPAALLTNPLQLEVLKGILFYLMSGLILFGSPLSLPSTKGATSPIPSLLQKQKFLCAILILQISRFTTFSHLREPPDSTILNHHYHNKSPHFFNSTLINPNNNHNNNLKNSIITNWMNQKICCKNS